MQLVMFVSGHGIATARALLEAADDSFGLNLPLRKQVKVYYKVRVHARAARTAATCRRTSNSSLA